MLSDTHPDAEAMWIGLLRTATVKQRLARTIQLTQIVRDKESSRSGGRIWTGAASNHGQRNWGSGTCCCVR